MSTTPTTTSAPVLPVWADRWAPTPASRGRAAVGLTTAYTLTNPSAPTSARLEAVQAPGHPPTVWLTLENADGPHTYLLTPRTLASLADALTDYSHRCTRAGLTPAADD